MEELRAPARPARGPPRRARRRRLPWLRVLAAAAVIFGLALAALTVIESLVGRPLSSATGGSQPYAAGRTSVSRILRPDLSGHLPMPRPVSSPTPAAGREPEACLGMQRLKAAVSQTVVCGTASRSATVAAVPPKTSTPPPCHTRVLTSTGGREIAGVRLDTVATVRAALHDDHVGVDDLVTANAWEGNERLAESVAALVGLAPAAFGVLSNRDHLLDELARRARAEGERAM